MCPICSVDCTDSEKTETKNAIELACSTFSILFDCHPLRTLQQEIKRWDNTFKLPMPLKLRLSVLDETNPKKNL